MARFLAVVVLVLGGCAKAPESPPPDLVLAAVNVVDVTTGMVQREMDVAIAGRFITGIAPAVAKPRAASVVDARGLYLIPGLWDMHVHVASMPGTSDVFLPALVGYGVLGARDTHSNLDSVVAAKRAIAAGSRVGPRLFVSGELVDGVNSVNPSARRVATEAEARAQVRALKQGGADFVKVYSALSRDLYFAIADEAKKAGIPYAGHVTPAITALEASNVGQRTFEHVIGVEAGTSREEAAILAENWAAVAKRVFKWADAARIRVTQDSAKAAALFAAFKRNQTWQVPTLIVSRQVGSLVDGVPAAVPADRFIGQSVRGMWAAMGSMAVFVKGIHDLHPLDMELVGKMYRAGVPILAGTDFPNPYVYPGASLHDELALLVKAGLPAAAALRAATSEPARFLGLSDSLGTVAVGKVADLVLLTADPLTDIANTTKIQSVIQGGRVWDRASLDRLLLGAEAAAQR
ncbi:MAG: amidohydrolase [Gemmatimonadetes bacterium]|nr:amidohydrolase [Gemmatimonadota bacterium]